MQKITPCLWFDGKAEEAARFYVSVFRRSKIGKITHYTEGMPLPAGTVLTVSFRIEGQDFLALNGGPEFKFTEAISLMVDCKTQKEVDELWAKLTAGGGQPVECGWLKDKYGLSWQLVPSILMKAIQDKDPAKVKRVMDAMMKMVKIDIAAIQKAYKGT